MNNKRLRGFAQPAGDQNQRTDGEINAPTLIDLVCELQLQQHRASGQQCMATLPSNYADGRSQHRRWTAPQSSVSESFLQLNDVRGIFSMDHQLRFVVDNSTFSNNHTSRGELLLSSTYFIEQRSTIIHYARFKTTFLRRHVKPFSR